MLKHYTLHVQLTACELELNLLRIILGQLEKLNEPLHFRQ